MGRDHAALRARGRRHCTFPREDNVQDEDIRLHPEDTLVTKLCSDHCWLVEQAFAVRPDSDLEILIRCLHLDDRSYWLVDSGNLDLRPAFGCEPEIHPLEREMATGKSPQHQITDHRAPNI